MKPRPPKITYAHCQYFTNLPGMSCPLCGTAITPNVGHTCSQPEQKPSVAAKPKRRKA